MGELIGAELLEEFVTTVILSGRIKDHSAVSALLIASPECGKTSMVTKVALEGKCKNAIQLTDVTGRGIMELCKYRPELSHFILNDLVTVLSHRQTVNQYTLSVLNALLEEGISAIAFPGHVETFEHGKRAIIACGTPGMMKDQRAWWNRHGLASRMFPFYFDHPDALSIRIKDAIEGNSVTKRMKPYAIRVPDSPIRVTVPDKFRLPIRKLSDMRAKKLGDPKGYRRLKQYHCLIRSHALCRGERKKAQVNEKDMDFLERIDPFVSFTEPHLL